jgi:hypothetical protein
MNWIIWLSRNYDVYAFTSPNRFAKLKQSTIDYRKSIKNEATQMAENYFKQIEESNRQTSTSQHTGDLRKRQSFNVTIKKINYESIIATTQDGNEIRFYDKGFNLQVGNEITITGTPTRFIEVMGIKQTYINRVKLNNQ